MQGVDQVIERGVCVLCHARLGRVQVAGACAKAAVVERKQVDGEGMQGEQGIGVRGEVAGAIGKVKDGWSQRRAIRCRKPKARKLWLTGGAGPEVKCLLKWSGTEQRPAERRPGDRVEHQLPLSLVDQKAQRGVRAEQGRGKGNRGRFEQPARVDGLRRGLVWARRVTVGEQVFRPPERILCRVRRRLRVAGWFRHGPP